MFRYKVLSAVVVFISARYDILLDRTAELVDRMNGLGCPVSYYVYATATHLFIIVPGQPTAFKEAVTAVRKFLNTAKND